MNTEEKKNIIIQVEWSFFQNVQNEGGRADCQNNPETFYIMRKSQFDSWNEPLLDSYLADLKNAEKNNRNPIAEKYAWMMESTAPEQFQKFRPILPKLTNETHLIIDKIVQTQLSWMDTYVRMYPHLASRNRIVHKEQEKLGETSFETYLHGELCTYSLHTLMLYLDYIQVLATEGKNLVLMTMNHTVQKYGYENLDSAETYAFSSNQ